MTKPLWLLDVDGVLNALEPKSKHLTAWEGGYEKAVAVAEGRAFQIQWAPKLVDGIRELIELDLVEVQWLTTWRHHANEQLADLFGWSSLQVASTEDEYHNAPGWWKLTTAKRVAGNRPLIWTDDDLQNDDARFWLQERPWKTLAICPSYRGGLQPEEFTLIQDFCVDECELTDA